METKNSSNPVVWFEIYVDEIDRAKQFYQTVLDTKLDDMPDPNDSGVKMVSFPMSMDKPHASGSLVKMDGIKAGGNSTIVYFDSKDCAIEEARVSQAGGKVLNSKMSIGEYGFISCCEDSEGNTFGIHSMK